MDENILNNSDWQAIDHIPGLNERQVVVWRFDPEHLRPYANEFEKLLSPDEKARLTRFVNQESRQNFVICRGVLHFVLSQITSMLPGQVRIRNGLQGKPELVTDAHMHPVNFNISHTQDLCLIAFSANLEVGVDVEKVREIKELGSMARTYLSPEEHTIWVKKPDTEKAHTFYKYWCAKEAVLKATGCGLSIHPNQINIIEALSNQPLRGVQEDGCLFEFRDCELKHLPMGNEFQGWLAVFGKPDSICLYDFTNQVVANSGFAIPEGKKMEIDG